MSGWCWVWGGDDCNSLALVTRTYIGIAPLRWGTEAFDQTAWQIQEWVVDQLLEYARCR